MFIGLGVFLDFTKDWSSDTKSDSVIAAGGRCNFSYFNIYRIWRIICSRSLYRHLWLIWINMGCGLSKSIQNSKPIIETEMSNKNTFSLRKWRRVNPKHLKLAKGLFHVQESTPSKELSDFN